MASPRQERSPNVCGLCKRNSPDVYCACSGFRLYLCTDCSPSHTTQEFSSLVHQLLPAHHESPGSPPTPEATADLDAGVSELRRNLEKIDCCCDDLSLAVDALIAKLLQIKQTFVSDLQAWRDSLQVEIEESVQEVRKSLMRDTQRLAGKYSELLRNFHPGSLVLFDYKVDTSGLENALQGLVTFEYPQLQNRPELVLLGSSKLQFFNFRSETWDPAVPLSKSITFDVDSISTLLDANRVFSCGDAHCMSI